MDDSKLERILNIIREDVPTNSISGGKIAGSEEAGDDPPVRRKKKKYAYLGPRSRKTWMPK
jgi:hypothetical protein|tara:strand:- start:2023 stop:2205 length:183 start_codon:yes stop_codon:yes gene_type:complete